MGTEFQDGKMNASCPGGKATPSAGLVSVASRLPRRVERKSGAPTSQQAPQPMQNFASTFQTPTQGRQQTNAGGDQRHAEQQQRGIAQPDDDGGKKVPLLSDVRLACPQGVTGQGDVKRIRRADQEMKAAQITGPAPKPMPERENQDHDRDVERKKVRRQRDEKVVSGDDHVTALRSRFEFLDSPAEKPR